MPRRLLLDTASLYFRAFFGVPPLLAADGVTPVNAVRGLLDMVARFVRDRGPDELVACWDDDWRPAWRVALIGSYKAHRVAGGNSDLPVGAAEPEVVDPALAVQVPLIREVLKAFGIPVVGAAGYEADDVIGSLAAGAAGPVDVVTGDRDLFQLVSDDCTVLYLARGVSRYEAVDDAWLQKRYGIRGHQYVDFAVLRGDPSDGLPGVAGIGEKTAARLLTEHGDLDEVLAAPLPARTRKLLEAASDYLQPARAVVAVRRDLPLPGLLALPRSPADPDRLVELTERLSLAGPVARLRAALAGDPV